MILLFAHQEDHYIGGHLFLRVCGGIHFSSLILIYLQEQAIIFRWLIQGRQSKCTKQRVGLSLFPSYGTKCIQGGRNVIVSFWSQERDPFPLDVQVYQGNDQKIIHIRFTFEGAEVMGRSNQEAKERLRYYTGAQSPLWSQPGQSNGSGHPANAAPLVRRHQYWGRGQ